MVDLVFKGALYSDIENPNEKDQTIIVENAIRRSLEKLKSLNVLILLDNPTTPFSPSLCKRPFSFRKNMCEFYSNDNQHQIRRILIKKIAKEFTNVKVFDLSSLFCNNNHCTMKIGNNLLFRDDNHLNLAGSRFVAPFIADQISTFNE